MLLGGWPAIARTVIVGVLAYGALIILLRVSGKRTLSKFNAFDFVVTVAIGSTLATVLLSDTVALAQGVTALATLLLLQFVITWLSVRVPFIRGLVKSEPKLLFYRGAYVDEALRRERVTRDELHAAARRLGRASLSGVEAAVLETDGTITIIANPSTDAPRTLPGVAGYAAPPRDDS